MARFKPATYKDRDRVLCELGHGSYESYLQSRVWSEIRRAAMERDSELCRACGSRASEVHHDSYDKATLSGKDIRRLYCLCRDCHKAIEFDGTQKRNHLQSQMELRRLLPDERLPKLGYRRERTGHHIKSPVWMSSKTPKNIVTDIFGMSDEEIERAIGELPSKLRSEVLSELKRRRTPRPVKPERKKLNNNFGTLPRHLSGNQPRRS